MKINIGTAVAGVLAKNSAKVHMVSTSEDKLRNIKNELEKNVGKGKIEYSAVDILDEYQVNNFVKSFPKHPEDLYWVQSVELGAGSYNLKDDNPYLPLEDIPLELLEKKSQTILRATHLMMGELLPHFRVQPESRVAIVSSMSAIRGYIVMGEHIVQLKALLTDMRMLQCWETIRKTFLLQLLGLEELIPGCMIITQFNMLWKEYLMNTKEFGTDI